MASLSAASRSTRITNISHLSSAKAIPETLNLNVESEDQPTLRESNQNAENSAPIVENMSLKLETVSQKQTNDSSFSSASTKRSSKKSKKSYKKKKLVTRLITEEVDYFRYRLLQGNNAQEIHVWETAAVISTYAGTKESRVQVQAMLKTYGGQAIDLVFVADLNYNQNALNKTLFEVSDSICQLLAQTCHTVVRLTFDAIRMDHLTLAGVRHLHKLENLETFSIRRPFRFNLSMIPALVSIPSVLDLHLEECITLRDEHCAAIANNMSPTLRSISINRCPSVGANGLAHIVRKLSTIRGTTLTLSAFKTAANANLLGMIMRREGFKTEPEEPGIDPEFRPGWGYKPYKIRKRIDDLTEKQVLIQFADFGQGLKLI